jgi:hypothetical protein
MPNSKLAGKSVVSLDLFTDAYRVTGYVTIRAGGIQAELANPNSDYLELTDAYISRMHQPGEIIANYKVCAFRKDNISFILLQNRREGIAVGSQHGPSIFTRGRTINAFVTVPAFEITGDILHEGNKMTPRDILVQSPGNFQPFFGAHASAALYPDIAYSGDLILVRKELIGIFCLDFNKN